VINPQTLKKIKENRTKMALFNSKKQRLVKLPSGQVIGYPQTMTEIKRERRQARLQRRAAFRTAKKSVSA
jgi:hypothetical protein